MGCIKRNIFEILFSSNCKLSLNHKNYLILELFIFIFFPSFKVIIKITKSACFRGVFVSETQRRPLLFSYTSPKHLFKWWTPISAVFWVKIANSRRIFWVLSKKFNFNGAQPTRGLTQWQISDKSLRSLLIELIVTLSL